MVKSPPPNAKGRKYTAKQLAGYALNAGFSKAEAKTAVAIALAESGGEWTATNRNTDGSTDYGPWQINSVHSHLITNDVAWWNGVENARMAYDVYKRQGFDAWVAYKTGRYTIFLPVAGTAVQNPDSIGTVVPGEGGVIEQNPVSEVADAVKGVAQILWKSGNWVGNRDNWIRVAQVGIGGAMLVGALIIVARPYVTGAAKSVAKVVPAGKLAKGVVKK